jgi:hypothetical protein
MSEFHDNSENNEDYIHEHNIDENNVNKDDNKDDNKDNVNEDDNEDNNNDDEDYNEDEENQNIYTEDELPNSIHQYISARAESIAQENIKWAYDNLSSINQEIINSLDYSYYINLQYFDDEVEIIRYTIRTSLNNQNYEIKEICAGLLYFGISGINKLFEKYLEIAGQLIVIETHAYIRRGLFLSLIGTFINNGVNMEDIKMVLSSEELEKIPNINYKDLEQKIKETNTSCIICQDEFRDVDKIRLLPCKHIFHDLCVDNWLTKHSYKCPCCRKEAGKQTPLE